VDPPEELPGRRTVDPARLRQLARRVDEVRPHPVHAEGHEEPDEREDERPACVEQPEAAHLEVDRHDHALERQSEAEQQEREGHLPSTYLQVAEAEAGEGGEQQRHRDHTEHDQHTRGEHLGHVRGLEGGDEVAPLRVGSQESPSG
jgi:hypothetical protein